MKRACDSSHSESETKRLHIDHSTRDVVMLLDDHDVSRAVEQRREVCRRTVSWSRLDFSTSWWAAITAALGELTMRAETNSNDFGVFWN